jgi:2',3'-cyclic-nucleotide 2'-phosphodiesterase/3'-nucleotidase
MNYTERIVCLLVLLLCPAGGQTVEVTILATTDLHGHIYPYDYYTQQPAEYGLAKVATLIAEVRRSQPEALLIDIGDTIQGSPLESLYQNFKRTGRLPAGVKTPARAMGIDPMMLVMNALRYDAMTVGNHEFNYGLENLNAARRVARFPWLSANTLASGPNTKPFVPYLEKNIQGVRVAVVGLTTPAIPQWEEAAHYAGYAWEDPVAALRRLFEIWGENKPDLVVVAAHGGINKTDGSENFAWQVAQAPGVDAVLFGHTHGELAEEFVGDTLLAQPKNYGGSLARVDFSFAKDAAGKWRMRARRSRLLKVTKETAADEGILELAKPYHEATEQYLMSPIAQTPVELSAGRARFEDSALVDAIHAVQLHYTQADVSLSALFNPRLVIKPGPITVREAAALYVYDNTLYKIEATGAMLRAALENAARYFETCATPACEGGSLINPKVPGFNFDMAEGVEYEIDLTRPVGERIRNLRFRGKPLEDAQRLTLALNNYRAGGSGGYEMFRGAKVLWQSSQSIRELIIEYYSGSRAFPTKPTENWRILPEAARQRLLATQP